MNQQILKLRHVFLPFFLIVTSVLISYAALDWELNAHNTAPQGVLWQFIVPLTVTAILTFIFIRPKLSVLHEAQVRGSSERTGGYGSFYFILLVMIVAAASQIDDYLGNVEGKLTALNFITEINKAPPTRFYSLSHCYLNRKSIGCDSSIEYPKGGKPIVHFRIGCPMLDSPADTINYLPAAWFAVHFTARIPRDESAEGTHVLVDSLSRMWRASFRSAALGSLVSFRYLGRGGSSEADIAYLRAVERSPTYGRLVTITNTLPTPIVLHAFEVPFEHRNDGKLLLIIAIYGAGLGAFWWLLATTDLKDVVEVKV